MSCWVVDTVVLRYFLLVDKFDLLLQLLEGRVFVPRVVFDPDELDTEPESSLSELSRSIRIQASWAVDPTRDPSARQMAKTYSERLGRIQKYVEAGRIEIIDLSDEERELFAELVDGRSDRVVLRFPLGPGEAACVAVAVHRGCVFVSDDNDGLRALEELKAGYSYERVRRLLIRAGENGLINEAEANEIHASMVEAGFRDVEVPFPTE